MAIPLTVNNLNTSNKINIIDVDLFLSPSVSCLQVTHYKYKNTRKLKVSLGKKKTNYANFKEKRARLTIQISCEVEFKKYFQRKSKSPRHLVSGRKELLKKNDKAHF